MITPFDVGCFLKITGSQSVYHKENTEGMTSAERIAFGTVWFLCYHGEYAWCTKIAFDCMSGTTGTRPGTSFSTQAGCHITPIDICYRSKSMKQPCC